MITSHMPQRVVDLFEMVEVDVHDATPVRIAQPFEQGQLTSVCCQDPSARHGAHCISTALRLLKLFRAQVIFCGVDVHPDQAAWLSLGDEAANVAHAVVFARDPIVAPDVRILDLSRLRVGFCRLNIIGVQMVFPKVTGAFIQAIPYTIDLQHTVVPMYTASRFIELPNPNSRRLKRQLQLLSHL